MKILTRFSTLTLLLSSLVVAELPPPYYQSNNNGFKPSQLISISGSRNQYQTLPHSIEYSQVPATQLRVIPSKLTIEQLISLTEKVNNGGNIRPEFNTGRIVNQQLQQSYGPPSNSNNKLQVFPQRQEGANGISSNNNHRYPSAPAKPQFQANLQGTLLPQTSYGVPQPENPNFSNQIPSTSYAVPDLNYGLPNNNFNTNTRNIETLDKLRNNVAQSQQINNLEEALKVQHLPVLEAQPFRQNPQHQLSLLPVKEANDFNGIHSNNFQNGPVPSYLPPTVSSTTPPSLYTTTQTPVVSVPTTQTPRNIVTTQVPEQQDNSDSNEESESDENNPEGPNVSVATAFAGRPFFLQHPDGRLQRVVFQKTQNPGDKPEEYTANYLFQNIQTIPNTVYTPLISLG